MSDWFIVIAAATAGSVLSLVGGLYLLYGRFGVRTLQRLAIPFAAGALLAAAFLDLLPESLEQAAPDTVMQLTLAGIVVFFVLERSLSWFHHHHDDGHETRRNASLIVVGDVLHNFIDGLAIGAAFLVNPAVGLVTTAAIAAHEIPQELGDFGLLLSKGIQKQKVLIINAVSAIATIVGAVLVYGLGDRLPLSEAALLAVTAGFFIYIAASDIIPTIHAESQRKWANIQTAVLLAAVLVVGVISTAVHSFVPHDDHAADSALEHHHHD